MQVLKRLDPFATFQLLTALIDDLDNSGSLTRAANANLQQEIAQDLLLKRDAKTACRLLQSGESVFSTSRYALLLLLRQLAEIDFHKSSGHTPDGSAIAAIQQRLGVPLLSLADEFALSSEQLQGLHSKREAGTLLAYLNGTWGQEQFPFLYRRISWKMLDVLMPAVPGFSDVRRCVREATQLSLRDLWLTSAYMSVRSRFDHPQSKNEVALWIPSGLRIRDDRTSWVEHWTEFFATPYDEAVEIARQFAGDIDYLDPAVWRLNEFRERPMIKFPNGQATAIRRRYLEELSSPEGLYYFVRRAINQAPSGSDDMLKTWNAVFTKAHETYGKELLAGTPKNLGTFRPLDDELEKQHKGHPMCDGVVSDGHGLLALDFRHRPIVDGRRTGPSWAHWRDDIERAILQKLGQIEASFQLLNDRNELPSGPLLPVVVLSFQVPAELYVMHEVMERFLEAPQHYVKGGRTLRYIFTDSRCAFPAILDLATLERLYLVSLQQDRSLPSLVYEWSQDTDFPSIERWLQRFDHGEFFQPRLENWMGEVAQAFEPT